MFVKGASRWSAASEQRYRYFVHFDLGEATTEKGEGDKDETVREVEREVKRGDVKLDESSARDNKSMTETVPLNYSDARSQLSWDRLVGGSFPSGEGEDVSQAPRQIALPPHSIAGDTQHYPQVLFSFIVPSHGCDIADHQDLEYKNSRRQDAGRLNSLRWRLILFGFSVCTSLLVAFLKSRIFR